jgi:hypothetical protein
MKTSFETKGKTRNANAGFPGRQYVDMSDGMPTRSSEKKNDLFTPFLLTLPVIIMLIILIYGL